MAKNTNESVVLKLKEYYGDKYDYSKVEYVNAKTKIILTCKEHNYEFKTSYYGAIRYKGITLCPYCRGKALSKENTEIKEDIMRNKIIEYIKNSKNSKNIVIPDNFKYTWSHDKCELLCKKHGIFNIYLGNIQSSSFICKKCMKENISNESLSNRIENFINKSKELYGNDKFDYSEVYSTYKNNKSYVNLICKKHNCSFMVRANKHICREEECPKCKSNNRKYYEDLFESLLKELNINYIREYKIKTDIYLKNKPYDFYITDLNLLIEINGEQHYKKKFNMTDSDLLKRLEIDKNKKDKAIELGYSFKVIDKLSIDKIKKEINNISETITYIQANGNRDLKKI